MKNKETMAGSRTCQCPYCSKEIGESLPICSLCGAQLVRCVACGEVLAKDETVCTRCGSPCARQSLQDVGCDGCSDV